MGPALAAYEYLITLGQEVALVWKRRWTGSTWLFVANRYIMLGWAVVQAAPYTPKVCSSCLDQWRMSYHARRRKSKLALRQILSSTLSRCVGTAWIYDFFELAPYVITASMLKLFTMLLTGIADILDQHSLPFVYMQSAAGSSLLHCSY